MTFIKRKMFNFRRRVAPGNCDKVCLGPEDELPAFLSHSEKKGSNLIFGAGLPPRGQL